MPVLLFIVPTEAPEIDLDANLKQGLTVRAGCPIRLCATIRGRPPPKVTWRRMGIDNVVRKGHVDIIDTMTFLVIPDSTRDDSGKYSLTLQSPAGEKAVFVNVKVLGKFWFGFGKMAVRTDAAALGSLTQCMLLVRIVC